MVVASIQAMEELYEYEKRFEEMLLEGDVKLLRDIKLSKNELDDISENIGVVIRAGNKEAFKYKFPITLSLFIVWCTVFEYRDGSMWSNIFEKLNITQSYDDQEYFGDIFLQVLNKYGLIQVQKGQGKKYLSPILMHGYISNYYSNDLFNYLNKIYAIVLEEDTSRAAIDEIWNDVFGEYLEFKNLEEEKENLKNTKKELIVQIKDIGEIDEDIKHIKSEDVYKLEDEINGLKELIRETDKKIEEANIRIGVLKKADNRLITLDTYIEKLDSGPKRVVPVNDLVEIGSLLDQIKDLSKQKYDLIYSRRDQLVKKKKGIYNQLAVKEEILLSIKTKISTLGGGRLDSGWLEIDNYQKCMKELEEINRKIKKVSKYEDMLNYDENTSLNQILTASLVNLRMSDPAYFKKFLVETIQMIGSYFSGGTIDDKHPLYDAFIDWCNRIPKRIQRTSSSGERRRQTSNREAGTRLVLQSMKSPYIKLDTFNMQLSLIIPEQCFNMQREREERPYYELINTEGKVVDIGLEYIYQNNKLYIKEKSIELASTKYENLLFTWYNLRELQNISLAEVMIFEENGMNVSGNKLNNGYYYVMCKDTLLIDKEAIINEYQPTLKGYKIFEVYLNETKLIISNKFTGLKEEIVATNYDIGWLEDYNPIVGVYSKGRPVITRRLPNLSINKIGIDISKPTLKILVDDNLNINMKLEELLNTKCITDDGQIIKINIRKILNFPGYNLKAHKIKIILLYGGQDYALEEEFYFLPRTDFTYTDEGLKIKINKGMRFTGANYTQNGMEYLLPLTNKAGVSFKIYYDEYGWIDFWVEVPGVSAKLVYESGEEYPLGEIIHGSKREVLKDLFVEWTSDTKRTKSIHLFDNNNYLETKIYLKEGKARTSLNPYYDVLVGDAHRSLIYKIDDSFVKQEEEKLLEVYAKWELDNIKVYQKEERNEYILGIDYEENFSLKEPKYLKLINQGRTIFTKQIKNNLYIYVKKEELQSNNIRIDIVYEEKYDDIFGRVEKEIVAGTIDVKLKSKLDELERILAHGLRLTEFNYRDKIYRIKSMELISVQKIGSREFVGEEIYKANIKNPRITKHVYFYIDTERKILPFVVDEENDGAQFDPRTGKVFWEDTRDRGIIGPLENIRYELGEEK